jgi:hypothetical protein
MKKLPIYNLFTTALLCALGLSHGASTLMAQTPTTNNTKSSSSASSDKLPSDKYEQPQYKVIEKIDAIEVREYQPMLMAEVDVEGERSTAINAGFRILAGYIFGGNTSRTSIAMTSPVTQTNEQTNKQADAAAQVKGNSEKIAMTSPVTLTPVESVQPQNEKSPPRWTVAFMMPSQYTLDTLPKPNNAQIRFRVSAPERRVAIRFSGFSSQANLTKNRAALETFIAARKLKTLGEPMLAFYDDPFTAPWNRRNEWWVAIVS